jgi:hypothetical protein
MLKPLGIAPKNVGPEKARAKGYVQTDFEDAFARYLDPPQKPSSDDEYVPTAQKGGFQPSIRPEVNEIGVFDDFQTVQQSSSCTVEKFKKSNNDGVLDGWTVEKGVFGHCAQCECPEPNAPLVTGPEFPPSGIHLHAECLNLYVYGRPPILEPEPASTRW